MRIAITGGTGFIGAHLARKLTAAGHEVVLVSRGRDDRDTAIRKLPGIHFAPIGLDDPQALSKAFRGCRAIAHCAGINRERSEYTFQRVHVEGTEHVVEAARNVSAERIVLTSFLRARPHCGSDYHESKWAAEEIVRNSGLEHTILKPGVVYGKGDHMLDHLSHAFHTFPLFGLVGTKERAVRPLAVQDLASVLSAALVDGRLANETVAVLGPEELSLEAAVRRVAHAVGRRPIFMPLPLSFHYTMARILEHAMTIPLISTAQVRILSEGVTEAAPFAKALPTDLEPRTPFSEAQIKAGLPEAKGFGMADCRCFLGVRHKA